jgi:hypothetical protein
MKRKNTRGIPKFAYGGQVGNEILDFQRQYNPFLGDLPTYGMVGSQQPGAWMFFDDDWMRSAIPQPPSNAVAPPPMGPPDIKYAYEDGPDGGGADRYTDDWRGVPGFNVAQAINPDYTNLESFAGYNTTEEPGEYGSYENYAGADEYYGNPDAMLAANMADMDDFSRSSPTDTFSGSGRRSAPNRGPSDLTFDPLTGASTPAMNTDFTVDLPAEFVEQAPAQMGPALSYSDNYLSTDQLADLNNAPPGVSVSTDPGQFGAAIGSQAGRGSMVGMNEYVQGQMGIGGSWGSQGMGAMTGMAGSPVGQAALGALGGFSSSVSPDAFVAYGEPPGLGFTEKSAYSGISAMAPGAAGPAALGLAPGTPAAGAAAALMGSGLFGGTAPPANQVAGPASPGAAIAAPSAMDPLAGLTEQQIDALAAGYHDQAPAVGQASPIAGFETALAAAQAAAEYKGRSADDKTKGGYSDDMIESGRGMDRGLSAAGSSGGVNAGRGTPGVEYTGSSGVVGDKQGATGQDKGDTGDSGQGDGDDGGDDGGSGADGTSGGSGDDGGMGAWKKGGRVQSRGLPSMADQVARAGRGEDTVLAHITPKEAMRLDAAMGGPSFNPETGLREYGFFDDVGDFLGDAAKAVAPIAGGVLGGMFGGPLGAAAGAALGTTLVGGNLQQALLSGGVAGIGAYAAPKLAGGTGGLFGGGNTEGGSNFTLDGGGGTDAGMGSGGSGGGFLSGIMGNPLAMVGLGAAGSLGAGYLADNIGDDDSSTPKTQAPDPWVPRQGTLAPRSYRPYEGDYSSYAQVGGGAGHQFYDQVNPGVQWYAEGGSVEAPSKEKMRESLGRELLNGSDMTNPMSVLQIAQMAMPQHSPTQGLPAPQMQEPQQLTQPMPPTGQSMVGQWQQQAMPPWLIDRDDESDDRIANLIWRSPGGMVKGPGHGQADKIPAMLSNGEYVVSADVVSHLGGGSNDAGADRLDQMMANVRDQRSEGGKGLPPMAKSPTEYMGR